MYNTVLCKYVCLRVCLKYGGKKVRTGVKLRLHSLFVGIPGAQHFLVVANFVDMEFYTVLTYKSKLNKS